MPRTRGMDGVPYSKQEYCSTRTPCCVLGGRNTVLSYDINSESEVHSAQSAFSHFSPTLLRCAVSLECAFFDTGIRQGSSTRKLPSVGNPSIWNLRLTSRTHGLSRSNQLTPCRMNEHDSEASACRKPSCAFRRVGESISNALV